MAYVIESVRKVVATVAASLVLLAGTVALTCGEAGLKYELVLKPDSKIEISGNSSLHPWHSDSKELSLKAEAGFAPGTVREKDKKQALLNTIIQSPAQYTFTLTVPVKTLKSGTPGLAGKIHGTLKHKAHPDITFTMSEYEAKPGAARPNSYRITAQGVLEVSGQKKDITLDLAAEATGDHIKVTGEEELLMTDYGVKPPVFLMIKTDNKVLVKWELYLDAAEFKKAFLEQGKAGQVAQEVVTEQAPL